MSRRRPTGLRRGIAVVLMGLLTGGLATLPGFGAAPAVAAGGDIQFSTDGLTWSTGLRTNVFDTSKMLVPGDSLRGAFY